MKNFKSIINEADANRFRYKRYSHRHNNYDYNVTDNNEHFEGEYATVSPRKRNGEKNKHTSEFVSTHAKHLPPETMNLIKLLKNLDEEKLNILKDCEMTIVILDRIISLRDSDRGKPAKLPKETIKQLKDLKCCEETIKLNSRRLVKGQNYLFLYKFLRSFGYDNDTINEIIENNLNVIFNENLTSLNSKDVDIIRNIIPDNVSNKEIFNFVVNYSNINIKTKIKKVLSVFKIKENEEQIIEEYIRKNGLVQNFSGEEEKNAKFLKTISKLGGVSFTNLQQNVVNNLDVLLTTSFKKLLNYMAMFEYGRLDYEVLDSNLGVIREYETEFPIELYRYIEKSHEENLPLRSLETINRIKENYSYDTLKKRFPIVVGDGNVITNIRIKYKEKLNAQIKEHNFRRQRKEV